MRGTGLLGSTCGASARTCCRPPTSSSAVDRSLSDVFFFQAEDGIRDYKVTGVQTCALPIYHAQLLRSFWNFCTPTCSSRVCLCALWSGQKRTEKPTNGHSRGTGMDVRPHRSEERRVGKECRSRWSPYH